MATRSERVFYALQESNIFAIPENRSGEDSNAVKTK